MLSLRGTIQMKTSQIIAGALFDFAQVLALHPGVDVRVILSEWAADRGLDLDQAVVNGWTKHLAEVSVPAVGRT